MKLRATVAALAGIVLIACGTSDIGNDADVTIAGQLRLSDGGPAASVQVAMIPEPSGFDGLFELAFTVGSVGLICLAKAPTMCKGTRRATTDAEGKYSFTLKGSDAKTMLGNPIRVVVTAQAPSAARVETRFAVEKESIAVPAMTFWEPAGVKVTPGPQWVDYSWPIFPSHASGYRMTLTQGEQLVWAQDTKPAGRLDARAIEDMQGEFRPIAKAGQGDFALEYFAPPVPIKGQAGPAPSRGAACTVAGREGPGVIEPCVFTDGVFSGSFPTQSCAPPSPLPSPSPTKCAANTAVTIEASGTTSAVIVHGLWLSSDVEVYTSDDGLKWTKRGFHKRTEFAIISLNPPAKARYVKLRSPKDTDSFSALTEVALWP